MEISEFLETHPFYDYAARFWGQHARGEREDACTKMALSLFQNNRKMICATQVLFGPAWTFYGHWSRSSVEFCAVHLCSYLNLTKVLGNLIENGADAAKADGNGWTHLHYAAREGHEAIVRLLMQQRYVEIHSRDPNYRSPLLIAAEHGHEAVVRLLISDEIDGDSGDSHHITPLLLAARCGREAVVKLLLQQKNVDVNFLGFADTSPLSEAAWYGHVGVVELLISDDRVNINIEDSFVRTPLSLAVTYNHIDVVKVLLARQDVEIDVKAGTWYGSLLSLAAGNGHEAMVRLLLSDSRTAVDYTNDRGHTALARAAIRGYEAVVKLLISHESIDVNAKDIWG